MKFVNGSYILNDMMNDKVRNDSFELAGYSTGHRRECIEQEANEHACNADQITGGCDKGATS